jgi:hypothetical protein
MSNWTIAVNDQQLRPISRMRHVRYAHAYEPEVCTDSSRTANTCLPYSGLSEAVDGLLIESFGGALPSTAPRSYIALNSVRNNRSLPRFSSIVFILSALGLALLTGCGQSGDESVISEVSAGATTGNGQPKLVTGPDGTMYIIYVAPRDGTEAAIVSLSDDGGSTWAEETVLSRPGIPAGLGSLAFDEAGTLHATWVDYETVGHVWYTSRTDTTWSDGVKISPGPTYAGFPVVAVGSDAVHVLWYAAQPDDRYDHGSLYEIRDTSATPEGWTDPVLVSAGSDDALNPSAVGDQEGNIHSAWYQIDDQIYRVNAAVWDGGLWTVPDALSPSSSNGKQVSIDIGPDGTVYLVWGQLRDELDTVAFARQTDGSWEDTEYLSEGFASNPVVGIDAESNVFVAWASDNKIILRRWDGSEWTPPEEVGGGGSPTLASGDPVTLAWTRPTSAGYELVVTHLS